MRRHDLPTAVALHPDVRRPVPAPQVQVRSLDRHDEPVVGNGRVAQCDHLRVFVRGQRLELCPARLRLIALRDSAPDFVHDPALAGRRFAKDAGQEQVFRIDTVNRGQIEHSLGVGQLLLLLENLVNRRHTAAPSKRTRYWPQFHPCETLVEPRIRAQAVPLRRHGEMKQRGVVRVDHALKMLESCVEVSSLRVVHHAVEFVIRVAPCHLTAAHARPQPRC